MANFIHRFYGGNHAADATKGIWMCYSVALLCCCSFTSCVIIFLTVKGYGCVLTFLLVLTFRDCWLLRK